MILIKHTQYRILRSLYHCHSASRLYRRSKLTSKTLHAINALERHGYIFALHNESGIEMFITIEGIYALSEHKTAVAFLVVSALGVVALFASLFM